MYITIKLQLNTTYSFIIFKMFETLKKIFSPILWIVNKLSTVTPLAFYLWDYVSDIQLTIKLYQNCRFNRFAGSLFALLYNFLVSWFVGVRQSYSNKNNSELWPFKWMVLFGWC